jgi:hypothetical protein
MSSFRCTICHTDIIDTPAGYISKCAHWPLKSAGKVRTHVGVNTITHMIDGRVNTIDLGEPLRASIEYPKPI